MKEIYFKGSKIFEFDDEDAIQILGRNNYLIRIVIDIYCKVFSGYRFSDEDMEAMNGYYPEIKENGRTLKKNDINVIRLSDIEDLLEHFVIKRDSILYKYISSLSRNFQLSKVIEKIDRTLIELTICIDNLLDQKLSTKDVLIRTDIIDINLDKVLKSFIEIYFVNLNEDRLPIWLMADTQIIDLFISMLELILEEGKTIRVIIDKLDSKMEIKEYNKFIKTLFNLTQDYPNFGLWIIPSTEEGVLVDYRIFNNTYVFHNEIIKFGDFETTYESICRNYPDNNIPDEHEVLKTLLQVFPFRTPEKEYLETKETIIMLIFSKLLGEEDVLNIKRNKLSKLEFNYLNSFK